MPEGDTLHRLALQLRPRLVGEPVKGLSIRELGDGLISGGTVTGVQAVGKHLLIDFSLGQTLEVHLGMHGRVRLLLSAGEVNRYALSASAVLYGERWLMAVFRARTARLHRKVAVAKRALGHLGPDLLAEPVDYDEILKRLRIPHNAMRPLGEVLLDQRIACGIGNVYKSEALFAVGMDPRAPVRSLGHAELEQLYRAAARLMRDNLGPGPRVTRPGLRALGGYGRASGRYYVYRRGGQPCVRCGTPVQRIVQGDQVRSTYFCPRCQSDRAPARGGVARSSASR